MNGTEVEDKRDRLEINRDNPQIDNNNLESTSIDDPRSSPAASSPPPAQKLAHQSNTSLTSLGVNPSTMLLSSSLDTLANTRDGKKSPLNDAINKAKDSIASEEPDLLTIFEPLRLGCYHKSTLATSVDAISKLVGSSLFRNVDLQGQNNSKSSLADKITMTVCDCYSNNSSLDDQIILQIVKALLAIVLYNNPTGLIHHSTLLSAIRTVHDIFKYSKDQGNQMIAQAGLTQMVNAVFSRLRTAYPAHSQSSSTRGTPSINTQAMAEPTLSIQDEHSKSLEEEVTHEDTHESLDDELAEQEVDEDGKPSLPTETEQMTLSTFEGRRSFDATPANQSTDPLNAPDEEISDEELLTKDAFLVFRALCKLNMKSLHKDSEKEIHSPEFRSRLLSLHLIKTILNTHISVLLDKRIILHSSSNNEPTQLFDAVKQYLCLSLSRNAPSAIPQLFELCCQIFSRVLESMRMRMKREIEVILREIFLPILELKENSSNKQKTILCSTILKKLCQNPQAIVELYLNYDCDKNSLENIYEHLMNALSKIASAHLPPGPKEASGTSTTEALTSFFRPSKNELPPSLNTDSLMPAPDANLLAATFSNQAAVQAHILDVAVKRQALDLIRSVLASLVSWAERGALPVATVAEENHQSVEGSPVVGVAEYSSGHSTPEISNAFDFSNVNSDDPTQFESAKARKNILIEGIKRFNYKPKRGVAFLLEHGFIKSSEPKDIARFLLTTDGLNKAQIGEYLGEGEEENIAIMHAFVDAMNFNEMSFVTALRAFLQAFRLPGESQKIDRYMLKFAERYVQHNPSTLFANADTAYVMAYSVILLNTDAYNPQNKRRMTKEEFIKNNRGINDGSDLPEDYLIGVYDDIHSDEIRMKDEMYLQNAPPPPNSNIVNVLSGADRNYQKQQNNIRSEGMANKTEALFKSMLRAQRRSGMKNSETYFSASHYEHVKPMFEVAWMAILSAMSGPLQESDDNEIVLLCLQGFANAIKISCLFDLELERNAFVTMLAKFTHLNNLAEMKPKHVDAVKVILEVAMHEGNYLKGSWKEILGCVSQLERFHLISNGVDLSSETGNIGGRQRSGSTTRKSSTVPRHLVPDESIAADGRALQVTGRGDMVFSATQMLTGDAMVDFSQALAEVSWAEIQQSGKQQHPRLFSLQKLVDICYYNMNRIRLEWSKIWLILGDHFNKVCCHPNPSVSFFAIDALRQLAMRFLEKEELAHFKFQKDFLKPFEHTMIHNPNLDAKDIVLRCLQQMLQARSVNIRSGWRTLFAVFSAAAKSSNERIVSHAFDIVNSIEKEHLGYLIKYGSFSDLAVCITDFCKVPYQRVSLQAMELLRSSINSMLVAPECPLSRGEVGVVQSQDNQQQPPVDDPMVRFWFPILFSFYDIIMNGEDLEVRNIALDSLFATLKIHGSSFRVDFWDTVCQKVLFPIFSVLKSPVDLSRFNTHEDMTVWLSTTMVQALRNLVDLYSHYFEILESKLEGLLELLRACICQENDTLARIGSSCLQSLIESNAEKISDERWETLTSVFTTLFQNTLASELFNESLRQDLDSAEQTPADPSQSGFVLPLPLTSTTIEEGTVLRSNERRTLFKQIITKCVLQLLLIDAVRELLFNDKVYLAIPPQQLLRFVHLLDESYRFANAFNNNQDLRMGLWKVGFMKQLPNLLKQESSSASTLITLLIKMYKDTRQQHVDRREDISEALIPFGLSVIDGFNELDFETKHRNIAAWTPVVAEIISGVCFFEDEDFEKYLSTVYKPITDILTKDMGSEVRESLCKFFTRVGKMKVN
ncbi:Sec7-domain-containing protein [Wallemia mellicola CBS 633.66]|uniref:Sec7-domain-containing protein n=1 Tax=Wallemia mellicola (strain ATCC MYA-4683 / CBS 633.66) TaxID=671144 RepID=I4YGN0_WALMC|nr:Sec7-domain-containing protein [Wallemia mellicola CBS 633.66]EIM23122.1 Sec7-domain-containing protein [Wallemia mellicola CBS 633.66]|eukprot:XP_006956523.1 Sec7-domain-containing protein [Wallemia mellicola CBS 633.66]